jgi:hypothetical protein
MDAHATVIAQTKIKIPGRAFLKPFIANSPFPGMHLSFIFHSLVLAKPSALF